MIVASEGERGYDGIRCQNHAVCTRCWFQSTDDSGYGDRTKKVEPTQWKTPLVGNDVKDALFKLNGRPVCVGCWHDQRRTPDKVTRLARGQKRAPSASPVLSASDAESPEIVFLGKTKKATPPKSYSAYVISPPRGSTPIHCYLLSKKQLAEFQDCTTATQIAKFEADHSDLLVEPALDEAGPAQARVENAESEESDDEVGGVQRKINFNEVPDDGLALMFVDLSSN